MANPTQAADAWARSVIEEFALARCLCAVQHAHSLSAIWWEVAGQALDPVLRRPACRLGCCWQVVAGWRWSGTARPVTCRAAHPGAGLPGSGDVTSWGPPVRPEENAMPGPTVVLVHGAFADASGFAGVIRELESAGHTAL